MDELEFYDDAPFLEHAPFLRTMIANPNHIGCHTLEKEAQFVPGLDSTLCGSRSGANAVAVWQILHRYGSEGWMAKMKGLWNTSNDLCELLDEMNIPYTRNKHLNIVTMRSGYFSEELAHKYELVADSYEKGVSWWKIVIMPHVKQRFIDDFLNEVKVDPLYLQTL